ncbi:MaoC family dehydratase [Streptomyces sp. NPDC101219]|uniref:MaoC family dehydratase n=1 Tax=Streptomyces sp. NPDC101219 TaxID=3366131 RepID=UPI0038107670
MTPASGTPARVLAGSPALTPLLLRGALLSPFKRPRPDAAFPPTRLVLPGLRVDLARLAAYERVCGFPVGAGHLPVTYPHVLGFPTAMRLMSGRAFPLPLLGLVHTSVRITRHHPVPATAAHELTVYVEELLPHRRGTEAAVVTELRTDGALTWESRSTYLARHATPDRTRRTQHPRPADDDHAELPAVDTWHLPADLGRRYGAASGDRNPIHLHPLTARPFGFPRAIAHGMWTAARCLAAHPLPEAAAVRADFRAPVPLPGTVTHAADGGRFALRGPDGRLHLTGDVRPA